MADHKYVNVDADPALDPNRFDLPEGFKERKPRKVSKKRIQCSVTMAESGIDFITMKSTLDGAEIAYYSAVRQITAKQITNLSQEAAKIIKSRDFAKVETLEIRYKKQLASAILAALKGLVKYGSQTVQDELGVQKYIKHGEPDSTPVVWESDDVEYYLRAKATAQANAISDRLQNSVTFETLAGMKNDDMTLTEWSQFMERKLTELSDRELRKQINQSVNEAFNYGRSLEAERHAEDIEFVQYSAILDENICDTCEIHDQEIWPYEDERTATFAAGNPWCAGGDRCRCVLIYMLKGKA